MFIHNFKYSFKVLLKNKNLIFWAVIWPLILGTLFYLAFSNMFEGNKLDTIKIGIVNNDAYKAKTYLVNTMDELSNKDSDDYLFEITYDTEDNLNSAIDDKKIDAYLIVNDSTKIITKSSGINQTILKNVVDQVDEYEKMTTDLITYQIEDSYKNGNMPNVDEIYQNTLNKLKEDNINIKDISNKNMNYMMIEYYTLLAMACLYASTLSCEVTKNYVGNVSKKGARITLSRTKRVVLLLSGLLSAAVIQTVTMVALLLYTRFVLKVDYGNHIGLVIMLSAVGSIAGLALGVFVGSLPIKSNGLRTGLCNSIVMLGCFFAGMMGVTMKYVVDTHIPLLNKINPSNMITDGFYSLYYYTDLSRFYMDIVSLLVTSAILILLASLSLRRKEYDSI